MPIYFLIFLFMCMAVCIFSITFLRGPSVCRRFFFFRRYMCAGRGFVLRARARVYIFIHIYKHAYPTYYIFFSFGPKTFYCIPFYYYDYDYFFFFICYTHFIYLFFFQLLKGKRINVSSDRENSEKVMRNVYRYRFPRRSVIVTSSRVVSTRTTVPVRNKTDSCAIFQVKLGYYCNTVSYVVYLAA